MIVPVRLKLKAILICSYFLCIVTTQEAIAARAASLEVNGRLVVRKGTKADYKNKAHVTSTGRIDNYSQDFIVGDELKIDEGNGTTTGVVHNHGLITVLQDGTITGNGTIINYNGFSKDRDESDKATETIEDGGYIYTGGEYKYSELTPEQLQRAARYDLVNADGVTAFYRMEGGRIETPNEGQIPGTSSQESEAGRHIAASVTVGTVGKGVPSTNGSTSAELFKKDHKKGYDVSDQELDLHVDRPTYFGESFFSVAGFEQNPDGKFKIGADGAWYKVSEVDQGTVIRKTGTVPYRGSSGLSFESWDAGTSGINARYKGLGGNYWTTGTGSGDPVVIFAGDNSWFNGVFSLEHGGAIIDNAGSMFGGQINLGRVGDVRARGDSYATAQALHQALDLPDPNTSSAAHEYAKATPATEFESQGGAKDEYNRPVVYMNGNATMYFNIPADEWGERVFSWYGDIYSTPYDRIIFQKGTVLIKGDCSGFKGKIGVCRGAKFEVRESDATSSSKYSGVMFGGTYEVVDENGSPTPDGEITVDSTSGLRPLTLTSGTMKIIDNDEDGSNNHTIDDITIEADEGRTAAVRMHYGDTILNNTNIIGENSSLHLDGGDTFHFKNFTLREGTLNIAGADLKEVSMEGEVNMGSSITAWTNSLVDDIYVNAEGHMDSRTINIATWSLTNDVKLYFDFDPATSKADHFVSTTGVTSGIDKKFVLQGVRLLNRPTASEYRFRLLDFQGTPTERYPEVVIADNNFTVIRHDVVVGPDGITIVNGRPYDVTKTSSGVTAVNVDGVTYYFYGSNRAGKGNVLMTRILLGTLTGIEPVAIHTAGFGIISPSLGMVFDEFGYAHKESAGKYSFWTKTYTLGEKHNTIGGNLKSTGYGTIFGFDGKPVQLTNSITYFMPTVFANVTRNNMKLDTNKARQTEYSGGLKLAIFNKRFALEILGAYSYLGFRTRNNPEFGLKAKSHVFSGAMKLSYNLASWNNVKLRPEFMIDYSFIKTPKAESATKATTEVKNIHRIDAAPGASIIFEKGMWLTAVSVRYHRRFGTKTKIISGNEVIKDIDKIKKGHMEYSIDVMKRNKNNTKFGFKISKTTGQIKGIKGSINFGINF